MSLQKYEIVLVTNPDLDEAGVKKELDAVIAVIKEHEGSVEKQDSWGKRQLSYQINDRSYGHYDLILFDANSKLVTELERQLRINENVLRHLIVKKDKFAPDGRPTDQDETDESAPAGGQPTGAPATASKAEAPAPATEASQ